MDKDFAWYSTPYFSGTRCARTKKVGKDARKRKVGKDARKKKVGKDSRKKKVGKDSRKKKVGKDARKKKVGKDNRKRKVGKDARKKKVGKDSRKRKVGKDSRKKKVGKDSRKKKVGKDSRKRKVGKDSRKKKVGKDSRKKKVGKDSRKKKVGKDPGTRSTSAGAQWGGVFAIPLWRWCTRGRSQRGYKRCGALDVWMAYVWLWCLADGPFNIQIFCPTITRAFFPPRTGQIDFRGGSRRRSRRKMEWIHVGFDVSGVRTLKGA